MDTNLATDPKFRAYLLRIFQRLSLIFSVVIGPIKSSSLLPPEYIASSSFNLSIHLSRFG